MNEALLKALVTSLVRKSLLLSDQQKDTLLSSVPTMSLDQLSALLKLMGAEENIVRHPRDLNLEELIDTADDLTLDEIETVIAEAESKLDDAAHELSDATDQKQIDSIRSQLLS